MRILLMTPPMTQLNTPYPATAYLTGFLRSRGREAVQADPAIELFVKLFSRAGLKRVQARLPAEPLSKAVRNFLARPDAYLNTIDAAIRFLQGKDPTLAPRIASREFLPEGPRFQAIRELEAVESDPMLWAFGALGAQDQAKFLASLYLDDVADLVRDGIDPRFELSRYGEKLAASAPTLDPILGALAGEPTLVDEMLDEITEEQMARHEPDVVALTTPFPGNAYGAF